MSTRNEIRLVYELALTAAQTPIVKAIVFQVAQDQEQLWAAVDRATAQREQQAQQTPAAPVEKSAVETDGIDSAKAEARRQSRREARLAAKAAQQGVKPDTIQEKFNAAETDEKKTE